MNIIGAGLAGLLAANIFQRAKVIESGPESQLSHKAVLRFRSRAVGDAVGVDFRAVTVHKAIWLDDFVAPNVRLANQYSKKVIGKLADRSIWNLAPAQRWIAPEDLVAQLAERCVGRVLWGVRADRAAFVGPTISTIPMPALVQLFGVDHSPSFQFLPITVHRWRVPHADVFQTVYFPAPELNLYRASITGSLLIAESMGRESPAEEELLCEVFGIDNITRIDTNTQRYGKIAPIDEAWRRNFVLQMTLQHQVYSLGRFATWRNLLLDDVLADAAVIRRIMGAGAYAALQAG